MGNSLQEQLLKAGLVDPQKAKQARTEKRKDTKRHRGSGAPAQARDEQARKAQAEKQQRDRELNRKREEQVARRALAAQVRQLVEAHRLPRDRGDVAFHFADGKLLKRIYVTADLQQGLAGGRLAIARLGERYEVVPLDAAEKIRERDPGSLVFPSDVRPSEEIDDAYADFQVPDDLMW